MPRLLTRTEIYVQPQTLSSDFNFIQSYINNERPNTLYTYERQIKSKFDYISISNVGFLAVDDFSSFFPFKNSCIKMIIKTFQMVR